MVVDRNSQDLFGTRLANNVLLKSLIDFHRLRQLVVAGIARILKFLADNVITQFDTFVADEDRRTGNQLAHLMLAFAAEGAVECVFAVAAGGIRHFFPFRP